MGEPSTFRSIADGFRDAIQSNESLLIERLDSLNELIRVNGTDDGAESAIRFSALSRAIYYIALNEYEQTRKGKEKLEPSWSHIIDGHNRLSAEIGRSILPSLSDDDAISSFCRFKTRRTGNHSKRFYVGLAAYTVMLSEKGALNTHFLNMVRPTCEVDFPGEVRIVLNKIFDECRSSATQSDDEISTSYIDTAVETKSTTEIYVRFCYRPERVDDFEKFRKQYASPVEGHAHFVAYRPSRSEPRRLMKSFLAIGPRTQDPLDPDSRQDFMRYVHVYHPPRDAAGDSNRISRGGVVPLEDGVYLVGGQRQASQARKSPYSTMKVVALPWIAIERGDRILRALVMSANFEGRHVVSRMALRATPISRSTDLYLGDVLTKDLIDDLVADAKSESRALGKAREIDPNVTKTWASVFPLSAGDLITTQALHDQERLIMSLTSNRPNTDHGWDVDAVFTPISNTSDDGVLTKTRISWMLENEFGTHDRPVYQRVDTQGRGASEPFEFWTSLRFGPLTHITD